MVRVPKGALKSLAQVLGHALLLWRPVYVTLGWELLEDRRVVGFDSLRAVVAPYAVYEGQPVIHAPCIFVMRQRTSGRGCLEKKSGCLFSKGGGEDSVAGIAGGGGGEGAAIAPTVGGTHGDLVSD